jgi:hypothetical protein
MLRDYSYRAKAHVFVQYLAGQVYERTPEAAVRSIVTARAGEIVEQGKMDE